MNLSHLFSISIIVMIRTISKFFYRTQVTWVTPQEQIKWDQIRMLVMLNHTSLYEPLFLASVSIPKLWRAVKRTVIPVADITLNRPLVGFFFRALIPNAVGITRKRDETWDKFLSHIQGNAMVAIFPEGRMKRPGGLDKQGRPMSVKGGVVDILNAIDSGKMLIAYSGGLHHVQVPGQWVPNFFKTIEVAFEQLDLEDYKKSFVSHDPESFRRLVIEDLEKRMKLHCPAEQ